MKKNRTYKVNAFLMMLLAGTLSFSATAAASESGLLPEAAAQQQLVKGTIVDVNGNPIPGASVMVPGSTTGTVTQCGRRHKGRNRLSRLPHGHHNRPQRHEGSPQGGRHDAERRRSRRLRHTEEG